MIINQIGGGGDTSGAEWYVYSQTIPSQTSNTMLGDNAQDLTLYDSVWQLNFDISYPIEIAGESYNTWTEFAEAATQYYITTNKQQIANAGSYDSVTVAKTVGDGFKAFNIFPAPMTESSVTFPEFDFMIVAKFT